MCETYDSAIGCMVPGVAVVCSAFILRVNCLSRKKALRCFHAYESDMRYIAADFRLPEWEDSFKASFSKLHLKHERKGNSYTGLVGKPSANAPLDDLDILNS